MTRHWQVLTVGLAICCSTAAAQPPAERCERAEEKFTEGAWLHYKNQWSAAIPYIRKAAELCPVPPRPFGVSVGPLYYYQYLPFFYLGESHYNSEDFPNALRSFYLSSQLNEPERDEEDALEDLASQTAACEKWFQRAGPRERDRFFGEALRNMESPEDWEEAAEQLWNALQVEAESGKVVTPAGRWPVPYVPRFWLAKALDRFECYQLACDQLDRSLLNQVPSEKVQEERRQMADLKLVCEKRKNQRARSEVCQRWQCWLQRGGLKP